MILLHVPELRNRSTKVLEQTAITHRSTVYCDNESQETRFGTGCDRRLQHATDFGCRENGAEQFDALEVLSDSVTSASHLDFLCDTMGQSVQQRQFVPHTAFLQCSLHLLRRAGKHTQCFRVTAQLGANLKPETAKSFGPLFQENSKRSQQQGLRPISEHLQALQCTLLALLWCRGLGFNQQLHAESRSPCTRLCISQKAVQFLRQLAHQTLFHCRAAAVDSLCQNGVAMLSRSHRMGRLAHPQP
mmetsp:Transcript_32681/g.84725  ORF Transcript_32681/g.84725 Transcript_32681/m.84725 type:complete len:245 (+) Transcript_32681:3066-3800(+)